MLYQGPMRVFLITIGSLFVVAVLIIMARIWGLGQSFTLYEHAFFSQTKTPLTIVKVDSIDKAQQAVQLQPEAVLWLDVRFSRDKEIFVLPAAEDRKFLQSKREEQAKDLNKLVLIGGKLSEYPWEQIKSFFNNVVLLKDYYKMFPTNRFVLNIVDNVADAHAVLVSSLKDFKPDERTLIQSDALVIMTSVKELKPEWLYGTSVPDLMRLLALDSMWILPATQFKGDVFIAPFKIQNKTAFNDDIIAEMRRRKKRIFLGPITNPSQLAEAQRLQVEGFITEDLPQLIQMLGQSPAQ